MVAPATLTLGPCAGFAPSRGNALSFPRRPSLLRPLNSSHLKTRNLHEKLCFSPLPAVRAVAVDSDQLGSSDPAQVVSSSLSPSLYVLQVVASVNRFIHMTAICYRFGEIGMNWLSSLSISYSEDKTCEKPRRYYFVVANAKFMLDEEEHFKELLDERHRNFGERNREQDFWLVVEPKFLDRFPGITKRLNRPAVALVSTDGPWMT
ncbi:hypothetical protein B296_00057733 [Ensete ventricosum]|uniref:Ycf54-like protein n=1 Tax=Ensete ventricosum TaxID=4639 RepID=A0A426XBF5_ENSVE|nr:hypothetical protein B296_00057733 [Ensete ventricosum]